MPTIKRILCPIDFSDIAAAAAREAAGLARAADAELVLLHALHEPWLSAGRRAKGYDASIAQQYEWIARSELERAARHVAGLAPVRALLVRGRAEDAIVHAAIEQSADLIVMGTRGRKGLSALLTDSLTERVTRRARVPVVRVFPTNRRKPSQPMAARHGAG